MRFRLDGEADRHHDPGLYWGTFNSVWRKHADGSWKIVFDAGSAPDETPPDEIKALLDIPDECSSSDK